MSIARTRGSGPTLPEFEEDIAVRALPRRPLIWPGRALILICLGGIVWGVAGMFGATTLAVVAVVITVLIVAAVIAFGSRNYARGRSIDKTIEAVNAVIRAAAPTRDLVQPSRWTGGWIGYPRRFKIRYPSHLIDSDPRFVETLAAQVSNRMDLIYKTTKNDARRCVITLEHDPNAQEAERDEVREQLGSILAAYLPGVSITDLERTAEEQPDGSEREVVSGVRIAWPASSFVRVSAGAFQSRVVEAISKALDATYVGVFDLPKLTARFAPITPLPDKIAHPPRDLEEPMKVVFGQFRDGTQCIWDLDAPLPHVLIVGGTGGGKTVLLLSILTGLPAQAEIYPIDPKRLGLFNLDLLPGGRRAATREAAIVESLLDVKAKMDDRYAYLEENGPQLRETLHPIVLVIDEGEEMAELLNEWWKTGPGKVDWQQRFDLERAPTGTTHPAMGALGSILRLGREARVHVILASQQAAAGWLSTSSRSQFAVRIALRNLEASTSMMTFGSLAAMKGLENKPGRAWVSLGMGVLPDHAQIFWTPKLAPGLNDEDRAILHGLGITLPDDEGFVPPPLPPRSTRRSPAAAEPEPAAAAAPAVQALEAEPPVDEPAADQNVHAIELSVAELEDGMTILIDIDGVGTPATVAGVEADLSDSSYLVLNYETANGELGALSLEESDRVTVQVLA